jgi:zinc transporter ZupT
VSSRVRVGLSMLSAGVLAFLFMDVGAEGLGILETHLDAFKEHDASLWPVIGLFALLSSGFLAGVGGIVTAQRVLGHRGAALPPLAGGQSTAVMTPVEQAEHIEAVGAIERRALRTGMTIAAAIGLHNFAEGGHGSERSARRGGRTLADGRELEDEGPSGSLTDQHVSAA